MGDFKQCESKKGESKLDDFQTDCAIVAEKIARKGSHMFVVCIDGSNQSDEAFKSAMNLRGKYDHLCVFHAYRGDKPDLMPPTWRPNQLESKYEVELIGNIPSRLYSMCWKDRKGEPVLDVLKHTLGRAGNDASELEQIPDFVVMGHHGRKGPKSVKTTLGSTTDQALRTLPYPCIVVKSMLPTKQRSYLMAVNHTEVSRRGLDILMRLVNPRDKLVLFNMIPVGDREQWNDSIKEYYEKELEDYGPVDSKFIFVERDRSVPVTHAITEYVNDSDADLFAIAPRAKQDRSSITDYIVNNVYCSVLLCKN